MSSITFIANTGLQIYRFSDRFDKNLQKNLRFNFTESYDVRRDDFWIDELIPINNDKSIFARKSQLDSKGYLGLHDSISEDAEKDSSLTNFSQEDEGEFFTLGNIQNTLKLFEKKWIPLPFFKKNNINNDFYGPIDWVRVYFEILNETEINFVLMVDTTTGKTDQNQISPFIHENMNENIFSLSKNENHILKFMDSLGGGDWIQQYLLTVFTKPNQELQKPLMKHVASYVHLTRILKSLSKLPEIQLLSDKGNSIDVDLVLDIGNSKTCALLFENASSQNFNFNSVKKLEMIDFSDPFKSYQESFSTKVIFKEVNISSLNYNLGVHSKFQWTSPVRVGFEAEKLINDSKVEYRLAREIRTYNSSPKRYLWDTNPSEIEWEFHSNEDGVLPKKVYKKGISEQLNSDGSICLDTIFSTDAFYSRKSLMTFVYLEILNHSIRYINSIEFRSSHGSPSSIRKIKRILISCPTAMTKKEQVVLRECADEAVQLLNKYQLYTSDSYEPTEEISTEVIPSVKDLKLPYQDFERRKDWIYDEATSAQMVYLYAMIQHKFDRDVDLFFKLNGKFRNQDIQKSLVIGSLDIGAGTSDLMISHYDYTKEAGVKLIPDPLYWESFNLAGDDLLHILVKNIIIEGTILDSTDEGCTGVIENYARKNNIDSIQRKLNGFFGKDSNGIGYKGRLMRLNFINQVAIPIVYKYMSIANEEKDEWFGFDDLFSETKPNDELLNYFNTHFEFDFRDIKWRLSSKKVNSLIESVFSKLIKQISSILHLYKVDVVLLSGKPCSFSIVEELFMRYHPVSPSKLINLNNYWIGRWYPFSDELGYINDPKTIVTVGSLISYVGGRLFKFDQFRIDNSKLVHKLISTADNIGVIEDRELLLTPLKLKDDSASMVINSIPANIGFKRIDSINYFGRYLMSFEFNDMKLAESVRKKPGFNEVNLTHEIGNLKTKYRSKLPFKIVISRDLDKDKEDLKIEEILDVDGENVPVGFFKLFPKTMESDEGYWLDTGEFQLSISN
jgi:hypothetical protein